MVSSSEADLLPTSRASGSPSTPSDVGAGSLLSLSASFSVALASTAGAGKAYGDLNGYNITITGSEPLLANELSSTAFGTLTVAA